MYAVDEQNSHEPLRGFLLIEPISRKDGQSVRVKLLTIICVVLATAHKVSSESI